MLQNRKIAKYTGSEIKALSKVFVANNVHQNAEELKIKASEMNDLSPVEHSLRKPY